MTPWGLALASVGAILAWTRGSAFTYGFTDPKVVLIILGVVIASYWRPTRCRVDKIFILAVLLYGICMIIPTLGSVNPKMSLCGFPGVFSCSVLTFLMCASGLLLSNNLSVESGKILKKVIMFSGVLTAIECLLQISGADPFRFGPLPSGHAVGFLGSRIDAGALMVVLLTFSFNPLFILGILASGSRGALLALVVAWTPKKFRVISFVIVSAVSIFMTFRSPLMTDVGRVEIWKTAVHNISFQGTGPATFFFTFNSRDRDTAFSKITPGYQQAFAHNSVLEALTTKGIFGALSLIAFFSAPEMAGLWTICMFNPVSFEVIFIACVLMGIARRKETGDLA